MLNDAGLVSAPITYFDDRIRARITDSWQKCARIVGEMIAEVSSSTLREFHSDTFMFVRLLHLIDEDKDIEAKK